MVHFLTKSFWVISKVNTSDNLTTPSVAHLNRANILLFYELPLNFSPITISPNFDSFSSFCGQKSCPRVVRRLSATLDVLCPILSIFKVHPILRTPACPRESLNSPISPVHFTIDILHQSPQSYNSNVLTHTYIQLSHDFTRVRELAQSYQGLWGGRGQIFLQN